MLDITRAHGLNFLYPENDRTIGHALCTYGEFAPAELELISDYLNAAGRSGVMIDVGANIGSICLPLAKERPGWRFIAVEGHRRLSQVLSTNAFANGLYNVDAINVVVGEFEQLVDFPSTTLRGEGNFGVLGLHMDSRQPTERARMCTIDDLATPDTRFIKIDVEGHESATLRGAGDTLEKVKPVILLEASPKHETSNRDARFTLMKHGYRIFWFYSPFANLKTQKKKSTFAPPRAGDGGVLALPPEMANLWDLPEIHSAEDEWPTSTASYGYLRRFGY